jgi:hypothetical protein
MVTDLLERLLQRRQRNPMSLRGRDPKNEACSINVTFSNEAGRAKLVARKEVWPANVGVVEAYAASEGCTVK